MTLPRHHVIHNRCPHCDIGPPIVRVIQAEHALRAAHVNRLTQKLALHPRAAAAGEAEVEPGEAGDAVS